MNYNPLIEFVAEQAKLWNSFPTIANTDQKMQKIFEIIQRQYPRLLKCYEEMGEELFKYLSILEKWVGVNGTFPNGKDKGEKVSTYLVENIEILQRLEQMPMPPRYLFRALANLKSCPKLGEVVEYSPKLPATAWTEKEQISNKYCGKYKNPNSCGSVLLTAESKELFIHARLFVYPFHGELHRLGYSVGGKIEWGFYITSTMPVSEWRFC
ncbi:MAG: hypothetical protein H7831_12420 [Magnetococcus sp. WYHC-3]